MSELLIIDGVEHELRSLPLNEFFASRRTRVDLGPLLPWTNSALYRGYVGYWRITRGMFYLDRLSRGEPDEDIDPRLICRDWRLPQLAVWYCGKLRVPVGPRLRYVHAGWQSSSQYERIINVQYGRVVRERLVDHTQRFLESQAALVGLLDLDEDDPIRTMGLRGLSWLTEEGLALVAAHYGVALVVPTG